MIPVIDLFAGPGGLCEGFSHEILGQHPFQPVLSIEKDPVAYRTLRLRAFVHFFMRNGLPIPDDYYSYVEGSMALEELFGHHREAASEAESVAWCAELGGKNPTKAEFDERIRNALAGDRNWILIGGPPCQAYSLAGRSRSVGMIKNRENISREEAIAEFNKDPRQRLYRQYLRIIAAHSPAMFVMENVAGMLSACVDKERVFPKILKDLKSPGTVAKKYFSDLEIAEKHEYRIFSFVTGKEEPEAEGFKYLIKAENYGVPQARHRVILFGIRDDFYNEGVTVPHLTTVSNFTTVRDAIEDLPKLQSLISKKKNSSGEVDWYSHLLGIIKDDVFTCLDTDVQTQIQEAIQRRKQIFLKGSNAQWSRNQGVLKDWYGDTNLQIPLNHSARSHMAMDLWRYQFVSAYGNAKGRSPVISEFPEVLLPNHANIHLDDDDKPQDFADRFKVQMWNKPSSTVTSHISKDGHYFIHPDTAQCRSLTVREAARLQSFPDNYYFEGNRTEQYHQVGNAVPPYLAYQIATIVWQVYRSCLTRR